MFVLNDKRLPKNKREFDIISNSLFIFYFLHKQESIIFQSTSQ